MMETTNRIFIGKFKAKKEMKRKATYVLTVIKRVISQIIANLKENKCYNCNKMGHISTHSRLPKVNKDKNGSANVAKEKNKEFVVHTNNDKIVQIMCGYSIPVHQITRVV